jgi:hypothetical protein
MTSNASKTRWNAANYTQVKVSVDPALAATFKNACDAAGVSMAAMLSRFMAEYCAAPDRKPVKNKRAAYSGDVSTRLKRRNAVNAVIEQMERIKGAEELYRDNIPDNLRGSMHFENAEQSLSLMDEAIDILMSIY